MKGNIRYAGGARRWAMPTAAVAVLLGLLVALALALALDLVERGEGVETSAGGPPAAPTKNGLPTTTAPSAGATSSATATSSLDVPLAPRIVGDQLTFGAARKADTAAYAERHYGTRTWRLDPRLIVLHYTESDTYASARSLFEADLPNLGERPGTCAHYVVDQDGTIRELVPPTTMCRHAVGLNHLAIGIEFVQSSSGHDSRWAVRQVLRRRPQVAAGVALVEDLQRRFAIADNEVIGHAMVNDAKGFRDLRGWRNDHTDWDAPEVARFRAMLTTAP